MLCCDGTATGFAFSIMINRQVGNFPVAATNIHSIYCHVWKVMFRVLGVDVGAALSCQQWEQEAVASPSHLR